MYKSLIQNKYLVNIAFSIYHSTYALLYLETFFYNMYFVILCYYLIFNVFKRVKYMRALIGCFIGSLSLVYLLILIDSFIQNIQMCKELSYLIMDAIGLLISIVMFGAYRYNQIKQKRRIQKLNKMLASQQIVVRDQQNQELIKMKKPSRVDFNKPFKKIWLMIICNVFCQLVDLAESLTFKLQWDSSQSSVCSISSNPTVDWVSNLIFIVFRMYLGFIATIYVFRQKRKTKDEFVARIKSPSDFSSVGSGKNTLQMVGKQSFSIFIQNGSNNADNISELYERLQQQKKFISQMHSQ